MLRGSVMHIKAPFKDQRMRSSHLQIAKVGLDLSHCRVVYAKNIHLQ
jgi:hypothetical protein